MTVEHFRAVSIQRVRDDILAFAAEGRNSETIHRALRIRAVESMLFALFAKGKLHGTIHACLGQEFVGSVIGSRLLANDFVTSNHRGHGHFIGFTGDWKGLIDEIVGNRKGVCGGVGGSQHLCAEGFLSNGQQGGLVPVAAGVALDRKWRGSDGIVVCYIGDGTLGEGVVYESMNFAALWRLPLLFVCENNFYSQSTSQSDNLAGGICDRASAFGIYTIQANTWSIASLASAIDEASLRLRDRNGPAFLQVDTYRLCPHSKGDDHRDALELEDFRARDPLSILLTDKAYAAHYAGILQETERYAEAALSAPKLTFEEYARPPKETSREASHSYAPVSDVYFVKTLSEFYSGFLATDEDAIFLGEDISDPYGGAFKVTAGLKNRFPDRVISTPISEACLMGVGIGLAIKGRRPVVEIMFGDFMTFAMDQFLNNAAKFRLMYNHQIGCPLVVRAPMGGRRGYGPTHSQSLEKHFLGIADTRILSLNSIADVKSQLSGIHDIAIPIIIFENKCDYTRKLFTCPDGYEIKQSDNIFPTTTITPLRSKPTVTILSYGGTAQIIADNLFEIFRRTDLIPELIVPTSLFPFDARQLIASVNRTCRLATVEEGMSFAGFGSEVIAEVAQQGSSPIAFTRIAAEELPIPSEPMLEARVLPDLDRIYDALLSLRTKANL